MKTAWWMLAALAWMVSTGRGEEIDQSGGRVPPELVEEYFGGPPTSFLVDPQGLLEEDERKAREEFLRYHAGDSKIELRVLLFGKGQEVPSDIRVEEIGERFEEDGKPAMMALYFMGEPERTRVELSPALRDKLGAEQAERIVEQAVKAAAQKQVSGQQLEAFCVQMAIRTFELEQAAGLVPMPRGAAGKEAQEAAAPEPDKLQQMVDGWLRGVDEYSLPIALVAAALILGGGGYWIIRWQAVHVFPERRAEPRLGAEHGAGIGPVIEFGSSVVSPSAQRDQVHDPLGGI